MNSIYIVLLFTLICCSTPASNDSKAPSSTGQSEEPHNTQLCSYEKLACIELPERTNWKLQEEWGIDSLFKDISLIEVIPEEHQEYFKYGLMHLIIDADTLGLLTLYTWVLDKTELKIQWNRIDRDWTMGGSCSDTIYVVNDFGDDVVLEMFEILVNNKLQLCVSGRYYKNDRTIHKLRESNVQHYTAHGWVGERSLSITITAEFKVDSVRTTELIKKEFIELMDGFSIN